MLTKVLTLVLVVLIGLAFGIEAARYVHSAGGASTGMVNIHLAVFAGVLLAVLWLSRAWLARQWTRFSVWFELTLDELFDFNSLDVGDGLGSISGSTSSALSESLRGLRLMKLYDLRFGAGSAGELRREMDALHRYTDGSLNWQASNAAIIASMERRLAEVPSPGTPDYEACAQDALDDAAKTTCTSCGMLGHWSPDCPASLPRSHPPSAEDGLLPCRGCSWCGVDPGNLPDELWTECDGSGRYLPSSEVERQRQLAQAASSPLPSREGKQPDGSYVIEISPNESHEDVVRRHPEVLSLQGGDVLFRRAGTMPLIVRRKIVLIVASTFWKRGSLRS